MTVREWDLDVAAYLAGAFSGTPFDRVAEYAYREDLGAFVAGDVKDAIREAAVKARDANFRPSAPAIRRVLEARQAMMPDALWADVRRAALACGPPSPMVLEFAFRRLPTAAAWLQQVGPERVLEAVREDRDDLYAPFVALLRDREAMTLVMAA